MKQDRRQPRSMVVVCTSPPATVRLRSRTRSRSRRLPARRLPSPRGRRRGEPTLGCAHCRTSAARRNAQLRPVPTNDSRGSPVLSATQRPSVRLHGRGRARRPAHRSRHTDRHRQSRLRGRRPASHVHRSGTDHLRGRLARHRPHAPMVTAQRCGAQTLQCTADAIGLAGRVPSTSLGARRNQHPRSAPRESKPWSHRGGHRCPAARRRRGDSCSIPSGLSPARRGDRSSIARQVARERLGGHRSAVQWPAQLREWWLHVWSGGHGGRGAIGPCVVA